MSPLLKTILILPVPPGVGQIEIFPRDYHFCSKYPTLHANVLAAIQIYQKWPRKEPLWNLTYALTPSPIKLKIHLGIEDTLPLVLNWTFLGWSVCWKGLKGQWGPGSFEIFQKLVHPWRASHGRHEDHVTKMGLAKLLVHVSPFQNYINFARAPWGGADRNFS